MEPAIEIRNLRKIYSGGIEAVSDISFSVRRGSFYALLGPNGAGKSTILGIISSLIRKTSGQVSICGYDLDRQEFHAKQMIGIVPQEFNMNLFESPLAILRNQAGYFGVPFAEADKRIEKYLRLMHLWERRNAPARSLSGGMKRRLMIARGIIHEPAVLILDEPTAGVDIEIRHHTWEFMKTINRSGVTVILTTHYLEEAENLCDRVAIINKGKIMLETDRNQIKSYLDSVSYKVETESEIPADFRLEKYAWEKVDSRNLEVLLPKGENMDGLLSALIAAGLGIMNFETKSNKLEQLFVKITH